MAATPEHAARVLGLGDDATLADVRRVRREMALKHHPDLSRDPIRSSRHMARINAAADTLTAHLNNRFAPRPKSVRPDYRDFARQKAAHATHYGKKSQGSASAKDTPERPANNASTPVLQMILRPDNTGPSVSERALIRLATQSYCTVLDQISRIDPGPRVDTKALCYPHP